MTDRKYHIKRQDVLINSSSDSKKQETICYILCISRDLNLSDSLRLVIVHVKMLSVQVIKTGLRFLFFFFFFSSESGLEASISLFLKIVP